MSTSRHGAYPADKHNLVILSRFPITESRQIRHDFLPVLNYAPVTALPKQGTPAETRFDRPVLYAAVAFPGGRTLHVLNMHLKAPLAAPIPGQKQSALVWGSTQGWAEGFFVAAMKRAGQALEARLLVDQILDADSRALVVVCGDFNADSWEVPVRIVLGAPEDTNNPALAGRALAALELEMPDAHHYSVLHAGRRVMLDHILVSRGLRAAFRGLQVHNESLSDEVLSHPETRLPAESFHAPVLAEFWFDD